MSSSTSGVLLQEHHLDEHQGEDVTKELRMLGWEARFDCRDDGSASRGTAIILNPRCMNGVSRDSIKFSGGLDGTITTAVVELPNTTHIHLASVYIPPDPRQKIETMRRIMNSGMITKDTVETQFTNQEREARGNIIQLLGATQNVAGDGSCFIYAVLLGMKQLDHRAGMCPSARDLQVQQQLRERIAQWWIDHPTIVDIDAVNGHGDLITRPQRSTHVVLLMSLMHISSSPDPYGHGSTDMHA